MGLALNFSEGAGGGGGRSLRGGRRGGGEGSRRPGHFGELRTGPRGARNGAPLWRVGKAGRPRGGGSGGAELCCSGDRALGLGGGGPPAWWGACWGWRGRPRELRPGRPGEGAGPDFCNLRGMRKKLGLAGEGARKPNDSESPHPQDDPRGGEVRARASAGACLLAGGRGGWRSWVPTQCGLRSPCGRSQACTEHRGGTSLTSTRPLGLSGLQLPVPPWPEAMRGLHNPAVPTLGAHTSQPALPRSTVGLPSLSSAPSVSPGACRVRVNAWGGLGLRGRW